MPHRVLFARPAALPMLHEVTIRQTSIDNEWLGRGLHHVVAPSLNPNANLMTKTHFY